MYCSCSPTKNGFRSEAYKDLSESISSLNILIKELQKKRDETPAKRTAEIVKETQSVWNRCATRYSMEECVNADVKIRVQRKCYPNCLSMCEYDRGSFWNINSSHQYGPPCDSNSAWMANIPDLAVQNGEVEPSLTNPNPARAKKLDGNAVNARGTLAPKPGRTRADIGVSSIPLDEVETELFNDKPSPRPSRRPRPVSNAPAASPRPAGARPAAIAQPAGEAEASPSPVDGAAVPVAPTPTVALEPEIGGSPSPTPAENVNEGCVAVEHLQGAVLQYKRSFSRSVLCAHDFCATPNHAIIVDNVWTSMQRLCASEWRCVESVRTVNNLNVFANRRVTLDTKKKHGVDIIITPYDARFPRWCSWVAQFAYESLHLVLASWVLGALTAVAFLVAAAVKEY